VNFYPIHIPGADFIFGENSRRVIAAGASSFFTNYQSECARGTNSAALRFGFELVVRGLAARAEASTMTELNVKYRTMSPRDAF